MANFVHPVSKNHSNKTMFIHYETGKHLLTINNETGERKSYLAGYVEYDSDFHYLCPGCITINRVVPIGD